MAKKSIIPLELLHKNSKSDDLFLVQQDFQNYCLTILKAEVQKDEFKNLQIYTLGSLSYGGLCPYSDVDLLAVGDKSLVDRFSIQIGSKLANVKIKWWPTLDFKFATDIYDHVALFYLKELFPEDQTILNDFKKLQSNWIRKNLEVYQQELAKDRRLRRARYGSVGGELAPNLKYGPGGLRDSCQALAWLNWSMTIPQGAEVKLDDSYAAGAELNFKLTSNLKHIYQLRFMVQLKFATDQITLENWSDILGAKFKDKLNTGAEVKLDDSFTDKTRSTEYQKKSYQTLYQQFTLTDMIFANKSLSLVQDLYDLETKINFTLESLALLDPSNAKVLAYLIKIKVLESKNVQKLKLKKTKRIFQSKIYSWIEDLFLSPNQAWQIDFILDSGLFGTLLADWHFISGLTQSDHYHKYTVSEHLRQTLKAVCDLQTQIDLRFSIHDSSKELTNEDWARLKWVAVFHDLKKGHPEDHSHLGKSEVLSFQYFSDEQRALVACLVEHHLKLSTFAFRFEHSDETQLEGLNQLFEVSHWIRLLLVFTSADIMGSNPQAWNKWKSDQLYFAYKSLMAFRNHRINVESESIEDFELSPQLVKVISLELLQEDIALLKQNKIYGQVQEDWLVEDIDNNLWVRVFKIDSGPGTLSQILNIFYLAGLPVEQAFIASSNEGYVYDWFRLPSTFAKPKQQIQKRLKILNEQPKIKAKMLMAQVDKVVYLTQNKDKLSFLFKGQDQNGVLLYISKIFESLGVNIQKAQINTWGQRLEDLFVVKKENHDPQVLLENLQKSLKLPQSIKI